jgi:hypothetical protein
MAGGFMPPILSPPQISYGLMKLLSDGKQDHTF